MNIRWVIAVVCTFLASTVSRGAGLTWITNYDTAVAQAAREEKAVLINFTGSDWCGWCIKLKAEVFDTPEFTAFAEANFVLLEVDFPQRKRLSAEQQRKNDALQEKFGIEGFPTLIVLNASGKAVAKTGYVRGGPAKFIEAVKRAPDIAWKTSEPARTKSPPPPAETLVTAPSEPWAGMPTAVKRYDDLKLTGLSGTATRRFAIVNNQTFAPGETARVKLKDAEVKLLCKEIRERSVVVQFEGAAETKELFLDGQ
ncbi:MAG TPA: thioredoxin family protein [Candidatus Acidoferrum sp.]|nr:thioredoxin family protein [Candidatus Acidoferrum sp.]